MRHFLTTLFIKNGRYAFSVRLDLYVFYVIMKRVPTAIKHLVKLILNEKDVKLLKFKRSPV